MKTKEELAAIKAEFEYVKTKLAELTDEELEQVTGGMTFKSHYNESFEKDNNGIYNYSTS